MSFKVKLLNTSSSFDAGDVVPASDSAAVKFPAILKLPTTPTRKFAPSKLAKCFIATVLAESAFVLVQVQTVSLPSLKFGNRDSTQFLRRRRNPQTTQRFGSEASCSSVRYCFLKADATRLSLADLCFFIYLAVHAVWSENKFEL